MQTGEEFFVHFGYAGVDFDPVKVDISLKSADGVIEIVKDGIATDYSEDEATKYYLQMQ